MPKIHIEKVVYRLNRLCHISSDGTINIIITSGGSWGFPNTILF